MTEYVAINSVPSTKNIIQWMTTNSWEDSFVVVHSDYAGKKIVGAVGSYGAVPNNQAMFFDVVVKDASYADVLAAGISFTHGANQRGVQTATVASQPLVVGQTIHIVPKSDTFGSAAGYTVTLKLQ